MIYENWFGVLNKKNELMAVEESEQIAKSDGHFLEIDPNLPTNRVVPVTILAVPLLEFVIMVLDGAKQKVTDNRLKEIAENAREFKKGQKNENEQH